VRRRRAGDVLTPSLGIIATAGATGADGSGGVARAGAHAREAERAGVDRVWCGEFYCRSSTIPLAVAAAATERIGVGSSVAYGVGRSPVVLAAEARDLDELSEGRLILGLGNGTRRMMQEWHGADPDAPAVRMEELVELLRELWRLNEQPVDHEGRIKVTPAPGMTTPYSQRLPIYTAGVNPRMVEVAGRVADGLLGHPTFTPRYVEEVARPAIEAGARKRDRDPADVKLVGIVMCSLHDDVEVARREIAGGIAFYAATRSYARPLELAGFAREHAAIRDAFTSGDFLGMGAAVSDDMIDTMGIAACGGDLGAALARYDGIFDHVILMPPSFGISPERSAQITDAIVRAVSTSQEVAG
jgi:probable F420-dependent oxidoreductase